MKAFRFKVTMPQANFILIFHDWRKNVLHLFHLHHPFLYSFTHLIGISKRKSKIEVKTDCSHPLDFPKYLQFFISS